MNNLRESRKKLRKKTIERARLLQDHRRISFECRFRIIIWENEHLKRQLENKDNYIKIISENNSINGEIIQLLQKDKIRNLTSYLELNKQLN